MKRVIYKEGDKVGEMAFIKEMPARDPLGYKRRALFLCKCGMEAEKDLELVKAKQTKTCGKCTKWTPGNKKYQDHQLREFRIWQWMIVRCYTKANSSYDRYGGRGIIVCERWRNSFQDFYSDMGAKPSPTHSIDRIDVNGNYEPGNCRWATHLEQVNNQRSNVLVTYLGETKTISNWARIVKIKPLILYRRFIRKWTPHQMLTIPPSNTSLRSMEISDSTKIKYSFGIINQ